MINQLFFVNTRCKSRAWRTRELFLVVKCVFANARKRDLVNVARSPSVGRRIFLKAPRERTRLFSYGRRWPFARGLPRYVYYYTTPLRRLLFRCLEETMQRGWPPHQKSRKFLSFRGRSASTWILHEHTLRPRGRVTKKVRKCTWAWQIEYVHWYFLRFSTFVRRNTILL